MTDVQGEVYSFGYALAMAALNPSYTYDPDNPQLPSIPVIQDQQDESAPSGLYVAVQGTPEVAPFGTPDIGTQDATDTRTLYQTYVCTLTFWEVNGNGSSLTAIREAAYLTTIQDLLAAQNASILDTSPVTDTSFKVDNTWKRQAHMTMTVSIASTITETLSTIVTTEITKV